MQSSNTKEKIQKAKIEKNFSATLDKKKKKEKYNKRKARKNRHNFED